MTSNVLPRFGKVAIVDNKHQEVEVVEQLLTANGIPYVYYDCRIFIRKPFHQKVFNFILKLILICPQDNCIRTIINPYNSLYCRC